jgi:hypothetical protein
MPANILRSSSVALMGPPRKVSVVFPSCSMSVSVFETSSGQVSLKGARVSPPLASEKELMKTIRSGATISR